MSTANLEELRAKIEAIAASIVALKKADPVDKEAIATAVKDLIDAKRTFAENNNGIGVDGKPFEEPMSKSDKKKADKKKKDENIAAASKKQEADPNGKKAAKKAEKAAKKKEAKAGNVQSSVKSEPSPAPGITSSQSKKAVIIPSTSKLQPFQITINPNSSLSERPVVALSVAVLTNTIIDYEIVSDHTRPNFAAMGLPNGRGELAGDTAIARYIARRASATILGSDEEQTASIEQWIDYSNTLSKFSHLRRVKAIAATLDRLLVNKTYVVGNTLTVADIVLFASLGFPTQSDDAAVVEAMLNSKSPTVRWMQMMRSLPPLKTATQLALGISNGTEACYDGQTVMDELVSGMSPLEGATIGNVVTRFPPEPSGYLHIGHAKAVLMNEYYARRYKGRLILRFDDTNPSKEKAEFENSILEDLGMLGVKPDVVTYTSDYFKTIKGYAEYMIENGLAFMDDTPQEQMQKERLERINSRNRDQSVEDAKKYFKLMCSGDEEGKKWCLRAKIDMQSVNGTMRDPVIFRQNVLPHHRSGTTYKAYPTYDLACPIVDSIEGVTHALRTTEYNDRDEQYQWIQVTLGLRRTRIHAFARMNFMYTELSKRKLTWFVENGYVTGWDDARFPTIRGVMRRGVDIDALRAFICSNGASRRIVNMEWNKFWAENKKVIDLRAKRFMAIDKVENVKLTVSNAPNDSDHCYVSTEYLPKDSSFGKRLVRLSKNVILEKNDIEGVTVGEEIVLMRWGVIKITKVEGGLEGEFIPDGDFKKAKRKLTWLADVAENIPVTLYEFDNLISKEKLEEDDKFQDFINPNTLATTEVIGDVGLKTLQKNEIIQLERRGYYRVDQPFMSEEKGLILFMVPDGKSKSMSGMTGKLAHR